MKLRNMDENKKTGKIVFETGIFFIVITLLCVFGMWQSVSQDWHITLGGTNFPQAFIKSGGNYNIVYLNQESIYISFLSVLFSFLGNKEEIVSIINLILQILGIFFFYLGAKKLYRYVFPLAIAVIGSLLSICFYPVIADTSMHIIWFLSGFIFWLGAESISGNFVKRILFGVLLGIFCYIDLAGFFLLITFTLFILMEKELRLKGNKIPFIYFLYFLLGNINGYFVMFYFWNNFRFDAAVFMKWFQDKTSFMYSSEMVNQYLSIAIVFGIIIIYYLITFSKKKTVESPDNTVVENTSSENVAEDIISSEDVTVDNISPKDVVEENTVEETFGTQIEIPEVMEEPKPIKFIENPLPLPKKHVKKEMNYAFEPTPDQMHYDLNNYQIDDDYDLKDI